MSVHDQDLDIADRLWAADTDLTKEGAQEIQRLRDQSAQRYAEITKLKAALRSASGTKEQPPDLQ